MTDYKPVPIEAPAPKVKIQPWGEEITLAETEAYTLKKLVYHAGRGGNLQMHQRKVESFTIVSGEAWLDCDLSALHKPDCGFQMAVGMCAPECPVRDGYATSEKPHLNRYKVTEGTFHIPAGAAHRFTAITECVVYEASTNVENDRVRLERFYGEPEVDGLPSTGPEPER